MMTYSQRRKRYVGEGIKLPHSVVKFTQSRVRKVPASRAGLVAYARTLRSIRRQIPGARMIDIV